MRKPRLSPLVSVIIERNQPGTIEPEQVTEYFGSSLKGGRAFARAIQKAQADRQARRVVYIETERAEVTVQTSVPITHENAETDVSPTSDDWDPFA